MTIMICKQISISSTTAICSLTSMNFTNIPIRKYVLAYLKEKAVNIHTISTFISIKYTIFYERSKYIERT